MRNEVGATLRALRESKGVSGRELAARIGCTQSYVSKMETGALHPSLEHVELVSKALNLTKAERETLVAFLGVYEAESHPLYDDLDESLARRQEAVERLESSVRVLRVLQTFAVPGLLQTERYARSIFSEGVGSADEAVKRRKQRQRILRHRHRKFEFVITEGALRNRVCSSSVMAEQLNHLRTLSELPQVSMKLLTWDTFLTKVPVASFDVHDDALVLMDTATGFVTIRDSREVAAHLEAFAVFERLALGDIEMFRAFDRIAEEHVGIERRAAQTT